MKYMRMSSSPRLIGKKKKKKPKQKEIYAFWPLNPKQRIEWHESFSLWTPMAMSEDRSISHSRVPMLWTIHFFLWLQVPLPTVKKNSLAGFTLKDHLYQCPNKLSEELIRCMAAIYCWVCNASITKSSAKVVLPRQSIGSDQDWSCRSTSTVEISRISTDGNQHLRASYGISSCRWEVKMLFGVILWSPDPLRRWPFFFFLVNAPRLWLRDIMNLLKIQATQNNFFYGIFSNFIPIKSGPHYDIPLQLHISSS